MVSREKIEEFKILYEASFDVKLTNEEATQMANDLVNLMEILLKPDPKPQETQNQTDNEERRDHETIRLPNS